MTNDNLFLKRAIVLAAESIEKGGGPFGAVITRGEKIISEAYNSVCTKNDPTAHAEILAIRDAANTLGTYDLGQCTIYSSCEPCPMCLGAIYWAGIKKVVFASDRNDASIAGFNDKFIYDEILLIPDKRNILFKRIDDDEAKDVFRKWGKSENKVNY
jgi:guanine deaminase